MYNPIKFGSIILFSVGGYTLEYKVRTKYLSYMGEDGHNDILFQDIGVDKPEARRMATYAYKYDTAVQTGDWPEYEWEDYDALLRFLWFLGKVHGVGFTVDGEAVDVDTDVRVYLGNINYKSKNNDKQSKNDQGTTRTVRAGTEGEGSPISTRGRERNSRVDYSEIQTQTIRSRKERRGAAYCLPEKLYTTGLSGQ